MWSCAHRCAERIYRRILLEGPSWKSSTGGVDGLPPVDWDHIVRRLQAGAAPAPDAHNARTTWLTTLNAGGSPHVTAVGAMWLDGTFWFQTGDVTQKAKNLARDGRCSVAVSIRDADVVVSGTAHRVTDEADPSGTGLTAPFDAPAQGPPPWPVYRLEPHAATFAAPFWP